MNEREKTPGRTISTTDVNQHPPRVSVLCNSFYYFLENVFILNFRNVYRLVAIHQGELLTDEKYNTLKNARIAFARMYAYRMCNKGIKAEWSILYEPEQHWLREKIPLLGHINGITD